MKTQSQNWYQRGAFTLPIGKQTFGMKIRETLMSLVPQLLVFQSRMFFASQYIHKYYFQTSFLQRKDSQPGKFKKIWYIFRALLQCYSPALLMQHEQMNMSDLPALRSLQILISWGEAFCWHKLPHPTLLGPVQLPPSHHLQLDNSIVSLQLNNQSLNNMQCKFPLFLSKIIASRLLTGKTRNVIFLLTFLSKRGCWAVSPFYTTLFNGQLQFFSIELHFKCRSTEGKTAWEDHCREKKTD